MFKTLVEGCEPTRGSKYSACVDLYASEDCVIGAGETAVVGLGVCLNIQEWFDERPTKIPIPFGGKTGMQDSLNIWKSKHYIQLMLRSSTGKKGLIMPNGVGVIDLDYKDEIKAIIHFPYNGKGASHYEINKGDKIAQTTIVEHKSNLFGIDTDAERTGGLGSTGK